MIPCLTTRYLRMMESSVSRKLPSFPGADFRTGASSPLHLLYHTVYRRGGMHEEGRALHFNLRAWRHYYAFFTGVCSVEGVICFLFTKAVGVMLPKPMAHRVGPHTPTFSRSK